MLQTCFARQWSGLADEVLEDALRGSRALLDVTDPVEMCDFGEA
jgi:hypothetical protein